MPVAAAAQQVLGVLVDPWVVVGVLALGAFIVGIPALVIYYCWTNFPDTRRDLVVVSSVILAVLIILGGLFCDVIPNKAFPEKYIDPALVGLISVVGLLALSTFLRHMYREAGWSGAWHGLLGLAVLVAWASLRALAHLHWNSRWALIPAGLVVFYYVWGLFRRR